MCNINCHKDRIGKQETIQCHSYVATSTGSMAEPVIKKNDLKKGGQLRKKAFNNTRLTVDL